MTVRGYPFESQDTTETQYSMLAREWQDPGVMGGAGDTALSATSVVTAAGAATRIAAGRAHAHGYVLDNDADFDALHDPGTGQTRVDRVVGRLNPHEDTAQILVLRGVGGSDTPPPPVRTSTGIYDVLLWRVPVAANGALGTLVDERDWVGGRVGTWTTEGRPVTPRRHRMGGNLTSGRLEYWDGEGWRYLLDQRDTIPPVTAFGGAIAGTTPAVGARLVQRTGTVTITPDASGAGAVSWPAFGTALTGIQVTLAYPGTGATGPVEAEWLATNPAPTLGGCRVALLDRDRNTVNTGSWTATVTVTGVD